MASGIGMCSNFQFPFSFPLNYFTGNFAIVHFFDNRILSCWSWANGKLRGFKLTEQRNWLKTANNVHSSFHQLAQIFNYRNKGFRCIKCGFIACEYPFRNTRLRRFQFVQFVYFRVKRIDTFYQTSLKYWLIFHFSVWSQHIFLCVLNILLQLVPGIWITHGE